MLWIASTSQLACHLSPACLSTSLILASTPSYRLAYVVISYAYLQLIKLSKTAGSTMRDACSRLGLSTRTVTEHGILRRLKAMGVMSQYTSAVTTIRASDARKLWDNLGYDEASVEAFNVLRHSKPPVSRPDRTRSGYALSQPKFVKTSKAAVHS